MFPQLVVGHRLFSEQPGRAPMRIASGGHEKTAEQQHQETRKQFYEDRVRPEIGDDHARCDRKRKWSCRPYCVVVLDGIGRNEIVCLNVDVVCGGRHVDVFSRSNTSIEENITKYGTLVPDAQGIFVQQPRIWGTGKGLHVWVGPCVIASSLHPADSPCSILHRFDAISMTA